MLAVESEVGNRLLSSATKLRADYDNQLDAVTKQRNKAQADAAKLRIQMKVPSNMTLAMAERQSG